MKNKKKLKRVVQLFKEQLFNFKKENKQKFYLKMIKILKLYKKQCLLQQMRLEEHLIHPE